MGIYRIKYIIGIDEAGRGPLAGPVAVGAVAIPVRFSTKFFNGIKDSKQLPQIKREEWYKKLYEARKKNELLFSSAMSSSIQIDEIGIKRAIHSALSRAIRSLKLDPNACMVILDGSLKAPYRYSNQRTIIGGDESESLIAAASIIAKVRRDALMERMSILYPKYGFERHKGYGTRMHRERILCYGICAIHRKSFLRNLTI